MLLHATSICLFLLLFLCPFRLPAQDLDTMSLWYLQEYANNYIENYQYEKALPYFREIAKIHKKERGPLDSLFLDAKGSQAVIAYHTSHTKESIACFKELLGLYEQKFGAEDANYLITLSNLGALHENIADYKGAEAYYKQNLAIRKKGLTDDKKGLSTVLNNLAVLYTNLGRNEEALPIYKQVLKLDEETVGQSHINYAITLGNLSSAYGALGMKEKQLFSLEKSIRIQIEVVGEVHPTLANAYNSLALIFENLGQEEKAEAAYYKSLDIYAKTTGKNDDNYIVPLTNLAELYASNGKFDQAEKLYLESKSISINKLGKHHPQHASTLRELGIMYRQKKDYARSEALLLEALQIFEAAYDGKHPTIAGCYLSLTSLYLEMKQFDQVVLYARKGLASNCFDLSVAEIETKNLLSIVQNKGFLSFKQVSGILSNLSRAYRGKYEVDKDIKDLETALAILKASNAFVLVSKNNLESASDKLKLLNETKEIAQNAMDLSWRLYSNNKNKAYLDAAFVFSETNKSAILSDAMKAEKALYFGGLPDSLIQEEEGLSEAISQLKKELLEAKDSLKQDLENQLLATVHKKEDLAKFLEEKYPKYFALKYKNKELNIKKIQQDILDENSLLLEYFVRDTMIYLLAITSSEVELFPIANAPEQLRRDVDAFRHVLSNFKYIAQERQAAYEGYTNLAYQFYASYLKSALETFSDKKRLFIVSDGLLGYIPFEALLSKKAPSGDADYRLLNYLVKDYEVTYSYSSALLVENKEQRHQIKAEPKLVAFAASYPEANKRLENVPDSRSYYQRELRKNMANLPSTIKEVELLETLFPNGDFFYKEDATEANFKKAALQGDILHLAMHGNLNPKHPLLSNLAFTEDADSLNDNFVEAHELSVMNLNANLVVLSACETGYGKFQQGEGVLSLARSFMYAGVPSLIVSLWQVNDNSTEIIMELFYKNLGAGFSKSKALQQAKIEYINNTGPLIAHPAFWAPFIQLGDPAAIVQKKSFGWMIGAGLLIGLLLLIGFRRKEHLL